MNKRMIMYMLGKILLLESVLLILPFVCGLIYKESATVSFVYTIAISAAAGGLLMALGKPRDKSIFAREGFAIVALAWITMSAVGALPFIFSGVITNYTDAFFETVSGFTTTGASVISDVEVVPHSVHLWRSLTHWVGGMGVLVLVMAIVPNDTGRSMHIMRAEMPGPIIGKLVPKITTTAKILYLIYVVFTLLEIVLLFIGGMPFFDSVFHSLGTAGTGGFSMLGDGLSSYSAYSQWVITVFMLIFGINFNIYYLLLMKKFRSALKSEEMWTYFGIVAVATGVITAYIYPLFQSFGEALRNSAFQVASLISTTGFATADFNLWPSAAKGILLIIMFTGACAGSTAGGFKLSRVIILFKQIRANLRQMLHSRSVNSVKFEGKSVDTATVVNVTSYLAIYCLCYIVIFLLISVIDNFSVETNISAAASCFNNIGPGFDVVGPMSNYSHFSNISTWILSGAMLLGRLEILPMILLFAPSAWIKFRKIKKKTQVTE